MFDLHRHCPQPYTSHHVGSQAGEKAERQEEDQAHYHVRSYGGGRRHGEPRLRQQEQHDKSGKKLGRVPQADLPIGHDAISLQQPRTVVDGLPQHVWLCFVAKGHARLQLLQQGQVMTNAVIPYLTRLKRIPLQTSISSLARHSKFLPFCKFVIDINY